MTLVNSRRYLLSAVVHGRRDVHSARSLPSAPGFAGGDPPGTVTLPSASMSVPPYSTATSFCEDPPAAEYGDRRALPAAMIFRSRPLMDMERVFMPVGGRRGGAGVRAQGRRQARPALPVKGTMITFRGPRPRNRVPFDGAAVGLERPGQVPAGVGRSRPDPRYGTGGDRRPDGERDTRNRRDVRPNLTFAVDGADKAAWTAGSGTAPYFWNAAASWWRRPCRRTWDCPGGERGTGNHGTAHPGGRPPGTCLWSRGPAHVDGGGTGTVQGAVHTSRGPPVPSERDGVEIDIRCLRGPAGSGRTRREHGRGAWRPRGVPDMATLARVSLRMVRHAIVAASEREPRRTRRGRWPGSGSFRVRRHRVPDALLRDGAEVAAVHGDLRDGEYPAVPAAGQGPLRNRRRRTRRPRRGGHPRSPPGYGYPPPRRRPGPHGTAVRRCRRSPPVPLSGDR